MQLHEPANSRKVLLVALAVASVEENGEWRAAMVRPAWQALVKKQQATYVKRVKYYEE